MPHPFMSRKSWLMLGLVVLFSAGSPLESTHGQALAQEPPVLRPILRAVQPPEIQGGHASGAHFEQQLVPTEDPVLDRLHSEPLDVEGPVIRVGGALRGNRSR